MMKVVKPMSRSVFNFRYTVKGTFNLGEICPIGRPIEVTPYDEFKIKKAMAIRMATPIAPMMDDLDAEVTAHFVPLRLIGTPNGDYTNPGYAASISDVTFEKLICNGLGNPADWAAASNELYTAPTAQWNAASAKAAGYTTIGEALGLGLGCGSSRNQNVLAYPLWGYNLIYQERFRNQDVEATKAHLGEGSNLYGVSGSDTATSGTDRTYNHALSVAYKHGDFFTNGKPAPVKGPAVSLPLGTTAPVVTGSYHPMGGAITVGDDNQRSINAYNLIAAYGATPSYGATVKADPLTVAVGQTFDVTNSNLVTNLANATAATINQFILSFNLQRLLMKDIKGSRYYELVREHFGVQNKDIELYVPELLNLKTFAINISPVVQQSGAASSTSGTDQGNYLGTTGGYSFTTNHGDLLHKAFGEFGYIYFLIVIRQRHTYGQGIPKMFLRSTRFDFFFPELGRIGYQKIDTVQLNADVAPGTTFAYQPAHQELRDVNDNQAFGFLNPAKANSLDYWTLAENLTTTPNLSMAFLKENRVNLARALTIGNTGPDFIMDAIIYGSKSTLVPLGSEPKLFN